MNKRTRKKKGLSRITNEEIWDLDVSLTKYILPRLIKFKSINTNSYPANLNGLDEWHEIIDKMIWAFKRHLNDKFNPTRWEDDNRRYMEGMQLFAEYFADLWD